MDLGYCRTMDNGSNFNGELMSLEGHQPLKRALLRLLDEPEIQAKIGAVLRRSGLTSFKGMNVPQRWSA